MILNINTSFETERKIKELQNALRLNTKAAVIRMAVGVSLKLQLLNTDQLDTINLKADGATYNPITIFGENSSIYSDLITVYLNENVSSELETKVFNSFIELGVNYLHAKYQYYGNYDKFMDYLLVGEL